MILEPMRLITAAMEDGSYGVNAKLSAMQSAGEFGADAKPPDLVDVLDPTQDESVAKGGAPSDWPVLLVTSPVASEIEGGPNQSIRDAGRVPISIAYVTRDTDGAEATRNALYTLRAVLKTLGAWIDGNESDRKSNGIQVLEIRDISFAEIAEQFDNGMTARGAVLATLFVRETSPT